MYEYPFGNGQQLNLDWFLNEWKNLLAAWEAEKNGIEGALQAEIDRAEAALADVFTARDAAAQSAANALESKNAAAQSASDASGYLATVRADANTASNAAQNAAQSESNAAESAQTALASKNNAANSERNAAQSEANALAYKDAAAQSAADALANKDAAAQSAADALANKDAAAQSAEDASDAAASVEASTQQITTNASDISNLKESFNKLTDKTEYTWQNGYINNSASTVDINNVTVSGEWKHIVASCVAGDVFTITAIGGGTPRAWAFIKADGTLISSSNTYENVDDTILTAPADSAYMVSNDNGGTGYVFKGGFKIDKITAIIAPVLNSMIANTALVVNDFRIVNNTLYRVTAPIASGGSLTVGTNVIATTIGEQIKALLT